MLGAISRRLAAGAILVVLALALQTVTATTAAAASLQVSPAVGPPGAEVTLTGSGFLLVPEVRLCWDEPGCSNLGTVSPDLFGGFTIEVIIPADATAGNHIIYACQLECASVRFHVEATASGTTTTSSTTTTASTTTTTASATTTTPPTSPTTTQAGETTTSGGEVVGTGGNGTAPAGEPEGETEVLQSDEPRAPSQVMELKWRGAGEVTSTGGSNPSGYTPPEPGSPGRGGVQDDQAAVVSAESPETEDPWLPEPFGFWLAWLMMVALGAALALATRAIMARARASR